MYTRDVRIDTFRPDIALSQKSPGMLLGGAETLFPREEHNFGSRSYSEYRERRNVNAFFSLPLILPPGNGEREYPKQ